MEPSSSTVVTAEPSYHEKILTQLVADGYRLPVGEAATVQRRLMYGLFCENCSVETLKEFLAVNGADCLRYLDPEYRTTLSVAIRQGCDVNVIRYMVQTGLSPLAEDVYVIWPIRHAFTCSAKLEVFEALFEHPDMKGPLFAQTGSAHDNLKDCLHHRRLDVFKLIIRTHSELFVGDSCLKFLLDCMSDCTGRAWSMFDFIENTVLAMIELRKNKDAISTVETRKSLLKTVTVEEMADVIKAAFQIEPRGGDALERIAWVFIRIFTCSLKTNSMLQPHMRCIIT